MATFWRISNFADLGGEGGRKSSGRWHSEGKPIVYLADCPASAMLERIVHLQDGSGKLPRTYDLLKIQAPDIVAVKELMVLADSGWKEDFASSRKLGDDWLLSIETPLARVPSAIVPYTWNYLLNPTHPDAAQIAVQEVIRERFDNRLFRFQPR
jgi:RES domain-containing protein